MYISYSSPILTLITLRPSHTSCVHAPSKKSITSYQKTPRADCPVKKEVRMLSKSLERVRPLLLRKWAGILGRPGSGTVLLKVHCMVS